MKAELKTLICVHKNWGSVVELLEMATEGRTSSHGWKEKASEGELADWILRQAWNNRSWNEPWHSIASQAWREYFASLDDLEQMMHTASDDDDYVDPREWLRSNANCDLISVEKIIPDSMRWKESA